jgi:hypothetical protein
MLLIEEDDNVALPKEHHATHNLCAVLYDQMADILADDMYSRFRSIKFDISESAIDVDKLINNEIHALDWLAKNQMTVELTDTLVSNIVQGLLADFLHFLYESLSTARKGKLSVAYALLRKPLSDILSLFEQILIDKEEFINRFYHQGDPMLYDPSIANLDKKSIVSKACDKLKLQGVFVPEYIYQVRHEKSCLHGIVSVMHQALHIVTRDKNYKTPNQDFNFVFSNEPKIDSYWKQYYLTVPYLLFYASSVLDEIVFDYLPELNRIKHVKNIKRLTLLLSHGLWQSETVLTLRPMLYGALKEALRHTCKMCQHELKFEEPDFMLFADSEQMLCTECLTDQFADKEFAEKFHNSWGLIIPL